jgi:cell fate regulator YaaT (PSP1 superfamily)
MNTYDWLAQLDIYDPSGLHVVEVSYKNGARKDFCHCPEYLQVNSGDMVVIDEGNGFNMGRVSLTGELVRIQMRRKGISEDRFLHAVVRVAHERDLERLSESRGLENEVMVRARAIARTLDLNMKIADVEYRGDGRKATFYYTADGRVDFRELVRNYAREFRVKVEMRQIGAPQESARIGGLGSCGRELCCSTWLTDFKSVNTSAARYQNLSINQTKLSGQCGRLKCCLNYELDTYLDALQDFPDDVDVLKTRKGRATMVKTDIFKRLIFYAYEVERGKSNIVAVPVDRIKEIKAMNQKGEFPEELVLPDRDVNGEEIVEMDFEDVTGAVELPEEKRRKKKRRKSRNRPGQQRQPDQSGQSKQSAQSGQANQSGPSETRSQKPQGNRNKRRKPRPPRNRGDRPAGGDKPKSD